MNEHERLIADLVDANHILFDQGVVDGFGHVSARDPADPSRFLIARSMAPALVGAGDIMTLDLNGNPVTGDDRKSYLERFIHAEIYRRRADVQSVVHSHSPAVIPFGLVPGVGLRPVCHMCGFIKDRAPVFEIRDFAGGGSDLLVSSSDLGGALARELGDNTVVLMRGHGSTVVGSSLRQAVFRAVYVEVNAKLQSEALRLGEPVYLTAEEADAASSVNDGQIDRAWELWKMQADARRLQD